MATFLERKMETTMLEKKKKMMRPSSRLEDRDPGLAAALALQDRAARARADQRRQELEVTPNQIHVFRKAREGKRVGISRAIKA